MHIKRNISLAASLGLLLLLTACALFQGYRPPTAHPVELEAGRPVCTQCHEERTDEVIYGRFDHTVFFMDNHRLESYQSEQMCSMCHNTSFCNGCHATRVELKPSERYKTENYRRMPHRGDYLSRHRIDGRIDPTSCFRCHGNTSTARSCVPCHG